MFYAYRVPDLTQAAQVCAFQKPLTHLLEGPELGHLTKE